MQYHKQKGYGFVKCDALNEKFYIRRSQIPSNSNAKGPPIRRGQTLEFSVARGFPLREAVDVIILEDARNVNANEAERTTTDSEVDKTSKTSLFEEPRFTLCELFDGENEEKVENGSPLPRRGHRQRLESDP